MCKSSKQFKIQLPTIWTGRKAKVGRVRVQRVREEKRRSEKRKGQKKEDAGAQRGKVSRLAKAAGAIWSNET